MNRYKLSITTLLCSIILAITFVITLCIPQTNHQRELSPKQNHGDNIAYYFYPDMTDDRKNYKLTYDLYLDVEDVLSSVQVFIKAWERNHPDWPPLSVGNIFHDDIRGLWFTYVRGEKEESTRKEYRFIIIISQHDGHIVELDFNCE